MPLALCYCGGPGSITNEPLHRPDAASEMDATTGAMGASEGGHHPSSPDGQVPGDASFTFGGAGCGLESAAFCDTFDKPSQNRGRAGELDAKLWSAGRMGGQINADHAMPVGMALLPQCRSDVPAKAWPPNDTRICDATPDVKSGHLLVGAAAQNYGQNGYRIRQPFDFKGRTGKIVFDSAAGPLSNLMGWISVAVTEDPISMPGYSIYMNDEGSIIPKNAVEVHFINATAAPSVTAIHVRGVHVFRGYADTVYEPEPSAPSAPYQMGKLNHFEVELSEHGVDVSITPFSEDGTSFAAPASTFHVDAELPFSRGYVHLSVHNHATLKYSSTPDIGYTTVYDSETARFDNVGFDGPVISSWREYEVPDALVQFNEKASGSLTGNVPLDPYNPDVIGYELCYFVQDASAGPKQKLHLADVDLSHATSATLSFTGWMLNSDQVGQYAFRARLNGHDWLERTLSPAEAAFFIEGPTTTTPDGSPVGTPGSLGRVAMLIDVPVADLIAGDNTVEFVTSKVPLDYPPFVCAVDLVLDLQ